MPDQVVCVTSFRWPIGDACAIRSWGY